MPDSLPPDPMRIPPANAVRRCGGVAFLNDFTMTDAERSGLQRLAEMHREHAKLIEMAIAGGTLAGGHAALMVGVRLGQIEAELSALLGRR